jgi:predicted component of type VI protein secretion system
MGARVVISLEGSIVSEIQLEKPVTVVGRHPDCDVVIDHAAISGRHMLFRVVNRTVYAEDLASTNGTRVNGLPTSHHVVHHLDLIEIGRHKLHFFDDALLSGKVGDLESTVLNQYEQTMLAAHVPQAVRAAAARASGDDIDRTMAIPRPPAGQFGPMSEKVATQSVATAGRASAEAHDGHNGHNGHNGVKPLALRGDDGDVVRLDRANTMIGRIGRDTALIIRRGDGFFIARLSGRALRLNRAELGPGTHPITEHDVIDVGVSTFEVIAAT